MTPTTQALVFEARRRRSDGWPVTPAEADALISALAEAEAECDRLVGVLVARAFDGGLLVPADPMRVTGRRGFVL